MNGKTLLLTIVGIVIVVGAVLHTILFPGLNLPVWLATAAATVIGYIFGLKQPAITAGLKSKGK